MENLLRVATVSAASAEAAVPLVTTTLAVEAAAAGAPHIGLAGELAAEVIAEAEAMQSHRHLTRRLRYPPQNRRNRAQKVL
jgi:hypothetical protein